MRQFAIMTASVLTLTACGSDPVVEAKNASVAEVAAKVKGAARIEPGKWRTDVALNIVDIPGLPPEIAGQMKQQMAGSANHTRETCVTPEMADRPPGELLGSEGDSCRYETLTMAGGRLDAVMVCKAGESGGDVRMTVGGDYGGSRYDLTSDMVMKMPGAAAQTMTIKMNVKGERLGACDGTEQQDN